MYKKDSMDMLKYLNIPCNIHNNTTLYQIYTNAIISEKYSLFEKVLGSLKALKVLAGIPAALSKIYIYSTSYLIPNSF